MRILRWRILAVLVGLCCFPASGTNLPQHNPTPGGIAVLDIGPQTENQPQVHFGQHPILLLGAKERWLALVGLAQETVPGRYILKISDYDDEDRTHSFSVSPLPTTLRQNLTRLPETLGQLQFPQPDAAQMRDLATPDATDEPRLRPDFSLQPVVANGQYIAYGHLTVPAKDRTATLIDHPWVTYLTAPDELVRAPGRAQVKQIFLDQNDRLSIILDHGGNLYSILNNLNETVLKPGELLALGDLVGTVGATTIADHGRVDWLVLLNGNLIDPLQLVDEQPSATAATE